MTAVVTKFCKCCPSCLAVKGAKPHPVAIGTYPLPFQPFSRVHMDTIGPLPMCKDSKSKYILVFKDALTRYVEICPIPSRDGKCVAEALLQRVITNHSSPEILISDNAGEFTSEFFNELCKLWRIKNTTITVRHPASNSLVERENKKIEDFLRHYVNKDQNNWSKFLPFCQIALNSTYNTSIGNTPHFLLNFYHKRLPYDLPNIPTPYQVKNSQNKSFVHDFNAEMFERSQEIRDIARNKLQKSTQQIAMRQHAHAPVRNIQIGDNVYLMYLKTPQQSPKLSPKWVGPYTVIDLLNFNKLIVKCPLTNKDFTVHMDNCKVAPAPLDRTEENKIQPCLKTHGPSDNIPRGTLKRKVSFADSNSQFRKMRTSHKPIPLPPINDLFYKITNEQSSTPVREQSFSQNRSQIRQQATPQMISYQATPPVSYHAPPQIHHHATPPSTTHYPVVMSQPQLQYHAPQRAPLLPVSPFHNTTPRFTPQKVVSPTTPVVPFQSNVPINVQNYFSSPSSPSGRLPARANTPANVSNSPVSRGNYRSNISESSVVPERDIPSVRPKTPVLLQRGDSQTFSQTSSPNFSQNLQNSGIGNPENQNETSTTPSLNFPQFQESSSESSPSSPHIGQQIRLSPDPSYRPPALFKGPRDSSPRQLRQRTQQTIQAESQMTSGSDSPFHSDDEALNNIYSPSRSDSSYHPSKDDSSPRTPRPLSPTSERYSLKYHTPLPSTSTSTPLVQKESTILPVQIDRPTPLQRTFSSDSSPDFGLGNPRIDPPYRPHCRIDKPPTDYTPMRLRSRSQGDTNQPSIQQQSTPSPSDVDLRPPNPSTPKSHPAIFHFTPRSDLSPTRRESIERGQLFDSSTPSSGEIDRLRTPPQYRKQVTFASPTPSKGEMREMRHMRIPPFRGEVVTTSTPITHPIPSSSQADDTSRTPSSSNPTDSSNPYRFKLPFPRQRLPGQKSKQQEDKASIHSHLRRKRQ